MKEHAGPALLLLSLTLPCHQILGYFDIGFTSVFTVEIVLKVSEGHETTPRVGVGVPGPHRLCPGGWAAGRGGASWKEARRAAGTGCQDPGGQVVSELA